MRKFLPILLFIFISINLFSQIETPNVYKGVIDLREWNFEKQKNCDLSGEWEFYWKKLYSYEDFKDQVHTPDAYINVPGNWNGIKINNKDIPDTGFATLRLVLFVNDSTRSNISLFIPEILSSYKVWFNDELITEVGKVGITTNTSKPGLYHTINSLNINDERNQIIIQISNFNHRSNSFEEPPVIGKTENIVRFFSWKLAYDFIFFGLAFVMAFYHFGLFLLRRKNIAALSFAILSTILAIRILFTDSYPIQFLFPDISWETSYFIAYITFFLLIPAFTFFIQQTFEEKNYKWLFRSIYIISFLFMFTLILPPLIYSKLLYIFQIFTLLAIFFCIYILIKYTRQKRKGAVLLFVVFVILFITGINDILYYLSIINTTTLLPFGVFILVLGQSLTLARIFTKSFSDNEHFSAKLDYQNQNLQELVKERIKKIEAQNNDIIKKNIKLTDQKEKLKLHRDKIIEQKDLLSIHNKFITSSINYASSIQKAILPSGNYLKKYFDNFVLFSPKNIVSGDFYWFSDVNKNYLYFAIGDCTGHGVPGAFLSIISMYLLNTIVIEKNIENPKDIIIELEKLFNNFLNKVQNNNPDGMDLAILRFEKKNLNNLIFSSAKTNIFIHDPSDDTITRYRGTRKSIGYITYSDYYNKLEFKNQTITLPQNYTIYCSTDGIVDQNNIERKRFGTKKLIKIFKKIVNLPILQQKITILKIFDEYREGQELRDDVTVIGLKQKM